MNLKIAAASATIGLAMFGAALPALADGDAAKGEKAFRACKSCHMIASPEETIVKGGRTGPNLYGIAGRAAGSVEDFRYSDLLLAAGAAGISWDAESFAGYVQDPTGWLKETTGESGRGKMTFRVRSAEDAADLWAYLASLAPEG